MGIKVTYCGDKQRWIKGGTHGAHCSPLFWVKKITEGRKAGKVWIATDKYDKTTHVVKNYDFKFDVSYASTSSEIAIMLKCGN